MENMWLNFDYNIGYSIKSNGEYEDSHQDRILVRAHI